MTRTQAENKIMYAIAMNLLQEVFRQGAIDEEIYAKASKNIALTCK